MGEKFLKVGDKVRVVEVSSSDKKLGIDVGMIGKIVRSGVPLLEFDYVVTLEDFPDKLFSFKTSQLEKVENENVLSFEKELKIKSAAEIREMQEKQKNRDILDEIGELIEDKAKNGYDMLCLANIKINQDVIDKLRQLGYKVSIFRDIISGEIEKYFISWEETRIDDDLHKMKHNVRWWFNE